VKLGGNEYNRSEFAGAFGDLGTLIPFVVGYITITRLDAQGVLLGFGLLAIATGLYFRTPMSVQPMKAIATVALTHRLRFLCPLLSQVPSGWPWESPAPSLGLRH
jgi:MFS superfamily molybdate transporter